MRKWQRSGIAVLKMSGNAEEELHKRHLVCATHVLSFTHINAIRLVCGIMVYSTTERIFPESIYLDSLHLDMEGIFLCIPSTKLFLSLTLLTWRIW